MSVKAATHVVALIFRYKTNGKHCQQGSDKHDQQGSDNRSG